MTSGVGCPESWNGSRLSGLSFPKSNPIRVVKCLSPWLSGPSFQNWKQILQPWDSLVLGWTLPSPGWVVLGLTLDLPSLGKAWGLRSKLCSSWPSTGHSGLVKCSFYLNVNSKRLQHLIVLTENGPTIGERPKILPLYPRIPHPTPLCMWLDSGTVYINAYFANAKEEPFKKRKPTLFYFTNRKIINGSRDIWPAVDKIGFVEDRANAGDLRKRLRSQKSQMR